MRCDRVPSALATGGVFLRLRARWHASRCPRCSEACSLLRRVAEDLSSAPPLTPAQRALWTSAAVDGRPVPVRWPIRTALAAVAASAALAVAIVAIRTPPRPAPPALPPLVADARPRVVPVAAPSGLDGLRADVESLGRELALLRRQAALLDERRDVEALWRRYPRLDTPDGS